MTDGARADGQQLLDALAGFGPILALKLYRLARAPIDREERRQGVPVDREERRQGVPVDREERRQGVPVDRVPTLPCLDHEAMLHEGIAPHAAVYVQEASSGDLHEVVWIPAEGRVQIDTVSTWGEHSPESRDRLIALLRTQFPDYRIRVHGPSWWRGERRVADACLAQVSLRDVLLGSNTADIKVAIDRLQLIGSLMEKQSRVASWGVRTVTGPLLAAAGVVTYLLLGGLTASIGEAGVTALQYTMIGLLGASFLYYGLKAVQLTEMSNRVWKRTAEYNLILSERQRLGT